MSFDKQTFLSYLYKLSESSMDYKYAYSYMGSLSVPKAQFSSNCKKFSSDIDKIANTKTSYQKQILNSISNNIKNENLLLAQDLISKLDAGTKKLIPIHILRFVERNA